MLSALFGTLKRVPVGRRAPGAERAMGAVPAEDVPTVPGEMREDR
jgi:hypothetical protein